MSELYYNDANCDVHNIVWSSKDIGEGCPVCKAEAERDALKELFRKYGNHTDDCQNRFSRKCACGFNEERQALHDKEIESK